MIKTVIDTNVLVSALLSPESNPAKILSLLMNGRIHICYDSRILLEYEKVLLRPKFPFKAHDVNVLIDTVVQGGTAIVGEPITIEFIDESDKKFYEVAKTAAAVLITGNKKHYPNEPCIVSPTAFLENNIKVQ